MITWSIARLSRPRGAAGLTPGGVVAQPHHHPSAMPRAADAARSIARASKEGDVISADDTLRVATAMYVAHSADGSTCPRWRARYAARSI